MAVAWHSVSPHAQSGDIVGTQGTGTQQGPSGQPDREKQGPGREGDAPTAACLGARDLSSAFPCLEAQGSYAARNLQGTASPWL